MLHLKQQWTIMLVMITIGYGLFVFTFFFSLKLGSRIARHVLSGAQRFGFDLALI